MANTIFADLVTKEVSVEQAQGEVDLVKGVRYVPDPKYPNRKVARPIAHTQKEAIANGWDWFDPDLKVWLRRGRKAERDIYPWQQDDVTNMHEPPDILIG